MAKKPSVRMIATLRDMVGRDPEVSHFGNAGTMNALAERGLIEFEITEEYQWAKPTDDGRAFLQEIDGSEK